MTTNWIELAKQLGALHQDGSESGGDHFAQEAFDLILGDEWIVSTVEHIIGCKVGRELPMNCLRYLGSKTGVQYAYEVYKTSEGDRAVQAVWLIKHIANPISINWIEEFLNDKNVIHWGIGVLDQLLWTEQIPYDERAKKLLELADTNSHGQFKEQTDLIRGYMSSRAVS